MPKPKLTPLQWIASLPLEQIIPNIPMPHRGTNRKLTKNAKRQETIRKMDFGNFIKVPTKDVNKWYCMAHELGRKEGFTVSKRKLNDKFHGIWKINPKGK